MAESFNRQALQLRSSVLQHNERAFGLRRLRSNLPAATRPRSHKLDVASDDQPTLLAQTARDGDGRRRSNSEPQRPTPFLPVDPPVGEIVRNRMPSIAEGVPVRGLSEKLGKETRTEGILDGKDEGVSAGANNGNIGLHPKMLRRASNIFRPGRRGSGQDQTPTVPDVFLNEYDPRIVDVLDVIDPQVSTLSSITNIQNSLFVPSLGRFINRRPTYDLENLQDSIERRRRAKTQSRDSKDAGPLGSRPISADVADNEATQPSLRGQYAVIPNGVSLNGWTDEEVELLDDYVRHMLHSRRSALKRSLRGFDKYVRKPLGFLVTLYAVLITLFGLAWVLFLIGWISVGDQQLYAINIIDNVLVALFAIVGDGLAPFRAIDTYRLCFIAHYHRLSWKLRKRRALPSLHDRNDLPGTDRDVEADYREHTKPEEESVLTPKQQNRLEHHQKKFARSHTFYKPHETETHRATELGFLIAIVVLLDMHSCFQIALGCVTWSISYHVRPSWLTAMILSCSITCNMSGGVMISISDRRTRKKDVVERMFREKLTEEAMKKVRPQDEDDIAKEAEEARRNEEARKRYASDTDVRKKAASLDLPRRGREVWERTKARRGDNRGSCDEERGPEDVGLAVRCKDIGRSRRTRSAESTLRASLYK